MTSNNKKSQSVSLRQRILSLPTLLSFGVAAAFIVVLATQFDLDWSATWGNIRSMNPWLYLLALLLYYMSFVFRGMRWRLLALNALDTDEDRAKVPSALQCSQVIVIGWFVNAVVWLRLGDAYRALAFSEDAKNTFSWSLGTVLAERVLDMATVAVVIFFSVLVLTATSDLAVSQYIIVMAFVMAFGVIAIILSMRLYGSKVAQFLPGRLEGAYTRFQQGTLGGFKSQMPYMLILGLAGWLLEMARLYFVVQALGLDIGLALIPVVALGHAILSTVPTPGGVGAVEPGMTGLLLLSLDRSNAVSVAIMDRSITYVSVIIIGGLIFLLRHAMRIRSSRKETTVAS
ncbi:MAG: lysylphosphatidylglycerol synthase transmembrane domain-containing protein [SAR202 cluster bacterium]|jgi:hypothetical protein|nr:lysylphosphatidylglycerol synthase transmembrane domain-containing protein [SAR202 cluster bacterium]MDP6512665.1 lysylphosphatidylglycerol synthase transmembrane domain-containing protein [SAR202 cluster bacterium]